ncbi:MAG: O-antigen ligase family protein [Desulfobacterales bacterium]|nr:O-antigen ligase family protein [Desulfobacterales bacterium]
MFRRSKIWVLSLVLAGYMCLTLLWADNAVFIDYLYYLRRLFYLFVFFGLTIELVLRYPKFIDSLFIFLCWVAAITAVVSICRFYSSFSSPPPRLSHVGDQLHNPVVGATVYGMVALICCFRVLKTRKDSYPRWLYIGILVVILFFALLTQGRGPLGALLITFLSGAVITRDKRLIAVVLCVIIAGGLAFFYVEGVKEMIISRGFSYRLEIWQQTLARTKGALLFGQGISTERMLVMADGSTWNHPHSVYFATILFGGLAGLFLLLALQALALRQSFLCLFRENDPTYVALLLFAFICITTANYRVISHPDALWMYLWLPLALLAAKEIFNKSLMSFNHNEGREKCSG